ncbi:MAG: DUF2807 domain-containing protein [Spirochaetaceae bacterium]|jgi:hypothetical protein|nr:DUF2807 domain-containing protein [Spirochaetaceae bacterium]
MKKFLFGIGALLSVSLFLLGCPTETERVTSFDRSGSVYGNISVAEFQAAIKDAGAEKPARALTLTNVTLAGGGTVDVGAVSVKIAGTLTLGGAALIAETGRVRFVDAQAKIAGPGVVISNDPVFAGGKVVDAVVAAAAPGGVLPAAPEKPATVAIDDYKLTNAAGGGVHANLTVYVLKKLTVEAASALPAGKVVAIGTVEVSGDNTAVFTDLTKVSYADAEITLALPSGTTTVAVTGPAQEVSVRKITVGANTLTLSGVTGLEAEVSGTAGKLVLPAANTVVVSGNGNVDLTSPTPALAVKVTANGTGTVMLPATVDTVTVNGKGSGDVVLSSAAALASLTVNGTRALKLSAATTSIADAKVNGTSTLVVPGAVTEATVTGSGNVRFTGKTGTIATASFGNTGTTAFDNAAAFSGAATFSGEAAFAKAATFSGAADFGGDVSFGAAAAFDDNVKLAAAKTVTLDSTAALKLKAGRKIAVGKDDVLLVSADTAFTAAAAGATIAAAAKKLTVDKQNVAIAAAGDVTVKEELAVAAGRTLTVGAGVKLVVDANAKLTVAGDVAVNATGSVTAGKIVLGEGVWKASGAATTIEADKITLGNSASAAFGADDGTAATVLTGTASATNTFAASDGTVTLGQAANKLSVTGSAKGAKLVTGATAGISVKAGLDIATATVDISVADTSVIKLADGDTAGIMLANAESVILLNGANTTPTDVKKAIANLTVGKDVTVKAGSDSGNAEVGSFEGAASDNIIVESGSVDVEIKKGIKTAI